MANNGPKLLAAGGLLVCIVSGTAALAQVATQPATIRTIELRGDATAIGRQHGQSLREPIRLLYEKYLRGWFGGDGYQAALQVVTQFEPFIRPEHMTEMRALAKASGLEPAEVLLANSFLDLGPTTACATITLPAAAAPDKVARFGRTLDFASMGVADTQSVLLIVQPKDRYAFAAVSWPGLIGVLSGMNEHGLALANMEVSRAAQAPHAMPYILLYRTVLEQCKTVDEAVSLLETTPRQSANNLMLMDAAGHRAVVEITPERITVRKAPADAALVSTNHQRGKDLDKQGRCGRYDYLRSAAKKEYGHIDMPAVQRMLSRVAQGDMTMQVMVFEPANRVMHVASGADATKNGYQKVELAKYFSK